MDEQSGRTPDQNVKHPEILILPISLRDYFAAAALTGIIQSPWRALQRDEQTRVAYGYADSMLKAREE
jgi:hypothetical protein